MIPVEAGERLTEKLMPETPKEGPTEVTVGIGGPEAVDKPTAVTTQELPPRELPNYQPLS